jgi:5S rRNA maturation endonuclease (ribonuclease M5)
MDEKSWLKSITPVRIFSPELLSVEGFDTKLEMYKLKQKCLNVNMSGRSRFEVESSIRFLDTLTIFQKDSSEVIFEMSPDYKGSEAETAIAEQIKGHEAMNIQLVDAKLQGNTLLDIGHAQIGFLKLNIADSSAVILSGGALRKFYQ